MSTYELDDNLVRRLLENPDLLPRGMAKALQDQLREHEAAATEPTIKRVD